MNYYNKFPLHVSNYQQCFPRTCVSVEINVFLIKPVLVVTGRTYDSMDFQQNPNDYHRMIVAVTISVGKRFSSRTGLPSAIRNNTTQRNPKFRNTLVD